MNRYQYYKQKLKENKFDILDKAYDNYCIGNIFFIVSLATILGSVVAAYYQPILAILMLFAGIGFFNMGITHFAFEKLRLGRLAPYEPQPIKRGKK